MSLYQTTIRLTHHVRDARAIHRAICHDAHPERVLWAQPEPRTLILRAARHHTWDGFPHAARTVTTLVPDRYEAGQERGLVAGSATWVQGAAQDVLPGLPAGFDYVFTCPPYHDLERYSDHPADLSAMGWEDFTAALCRVVGLSVGLLRDDAFATWVVGDLRDRHGYLRGLPARVDAAHDQAGARLVNDAVVAAPLGGKFGVIWRSWTPTRSATRIHSYAHTYVRGDRRAATGRVAAGGEGGG